ncbi:hypothetical protein L9F63_014790, partial [Diploptera punctata]
EPSYMHFCGGSIISVEWVLTAAHCVKYPEDRFDEIMYMMRVRVGSHINNEGGTLHTVAKIIYHREFDSTKLNNDVAVIKVREPFEFGRTVQPIPLTNYPKVPGGIVTVSGWGTTTMFGDSPKRLQKVQIPILPQWECKMIYREGRITDNMFCAGRAMRSACHGDSGGPVVYNGIQVGIVSWGRNCQRPDYSGVYTNVANLRDWIRRHSGLIRNNDKMITSYFFIFISNIFLSRLSNAIRHRTNRPIVGGVDADITSFPYQEVLYKHFWGGSIISVEWVLTAAHCVKSESSALMSLASTTIGGAHSKRIKPNIVHRKRPIVGGSDAKITNFPFQISFQIYQEPVLKHDKNKYRHFCGGTIISVEWVLTAAHCALVIYRERQSERKNFLIRAGSSMTNKGGSLHQISDIIVHPWYKGEITSYDNDVALFKVKPLFEFGPTVLPIKLNSYPLESGGIVTVIGWGTTSEFGDKPEILQKVQVPIWPQWECKYIYGRKEANITRNMFCAGRAGRSACHGDSGGPVLYNGVQPDFPVVYVNIYSLRDWIHENSGV